MGKIIALQIMKLRGGLHPRWRTSLLPAAIAAGLMTPALLGAQPSAVAHKAIPQTNAPAAHRPGVARQKTAVPAKAAQMPAVPPAQLSPPPPPPPPPPQWPVNDPPLEATVAWSAQGLTIDARNSSLQQILSEISAQTGVKIEGMGKDERVFGIYGPGQPREILSQLLDGTDYNVIMVGDGQRGVPQQIVLSVKPEGGPQPNAPVSQSEMYEPPMAAPYQPPPTTMPPQNMRPNQVPRTPQQILQEMQQRQQMMREEQMRQMQQQQQQQQQQQH